MCFSLCFSLRVPDRDCSLSVVLLTEERQKKLISDAGETESCAGCDYLMKESQNKPSLNLLNVKKEINKINK